MTRVSALAVFLLSAALLAFEVLLLRLFAIEQFHHFAYMVIGVAMLGFGASGTAMVLAARRLEGHEARLFAWAAAGFVVALVAAPAIAEWFRYDATQILFHASQWFALSGVYLALSLPFITGAAAIALALAATPDRVGRVYAANMLGSGVGALLALLLLVLARPQRALAATAVVASLAALVTLLQTPRSRRRTGAAIGVVAVAVGATLRPPWSLDLTPFKGLPQVEALAGAQRIGERWGATGWAAAVRAPAFRHAPGLSLAYTGTIPNQTALFLDGATVGGVTDWRGDPVAAAFLDWLPAALPYAINGVERVLVLGAGDGLDVIVALSHGARDVVAVELSRPLLELADSVVPMVSSPYSDPAVRAHIGDARAAVARMEPGFDLVVLPMAGGFGVSAAGLHSAGEDFLNTVEAYRDYLGALDHGGMLAITRWLRTPPRDNVRVLLTAARALQRDGPNDVGRALAVVRSWATVTVLVKPNGFSAEERGRLASFASSRLFDVDWPPSDTGPATTFHGLERPVFAEAARAAATGPGETRSFTRDYPFDVEPATDDRPFFGRFLRLRSLPWLLRQPRGSWVPFAEWGFLAILATLVQSLALALVLMVLPALVRAGRPSRTGRKGLGRVVAYFGALGLAYMFVEIGAVQKLTLVLGHPVYAAAAVLGTFLAFSGLGSAWSERLAPKAIAPVCTAVAITALLLAVSLDALGGVRPPGLGRVLAVAALAPAATLMGMPFPLGLRRMASGTTTLAWAWAANGFASVAATSLAVLLAMEMGLRWAVAGGGVLYLVAAAAARLGRRPVNR